MILHCVSLENDSPLQTYLSIRAELGKFNTTLLEKEEWVVLTKADLTIAEHIEETLSAFTKEGIGNVYVVSAETNTGIKELSDDLVRHLRAK